MRITSYILLLLAFATGVAASFGVAAVFFWKKPAPKQVAVAKPTIQVIVAKNDIPAGTRMHASLVRYLAAPIDEVPEQAIVNFRNLDNMKARLNIVQGCPICPEMLQPATAAKEQSDVFVPPGYRVVPIRIEKSRGESALTAGSQTNIVVVPRRRSGDLIEKHNAVLRLDSAEQRKVLMENVTVHSVQTTLTPSEDKGFQTRIEEVSLLLTQPDFDKLLAACHEGTLRLTPVSKSPDIVVAELGAEDVGIEIVKQEPEQKPEEKEAVAELQEAAAEPKTGTLLAVEEERPVVPNNLVAKDVDSAVSTKTTTLPNPENLVDTRTRTTSQDMAQAPEPLKHLFVEANAPTASAHRISSSTESAVGFVSESSGANSNGNATGSTHYRVNTSEPNGVSFVAPRSGPAAIGTGVTGTGTTGTPTNTRSSETGTWGDSPARSFRTAWQADTDGFSDRGVQQEYPQEWSREVHRAPGIDVIRPPRSVPQRSSYNPFNMRTGNSQ